MSTRFFAKGKRALLYAALLGILLAGFTGCQQQVEIVPVPLESETEDITSPDSSQEAVPPTEESSAEESPQEEEAPPEKKEKSPGLSPWEEELYSLAATKIMPLGQEYITDDIHVEGDDFLLTTPTTMEFTLYITKKNHPPLTIPIASTVSYYEKNSTELLNLPWGGVQRMDDQHFAITDGTELAFYSTEDLAMYDVTLENIGSLQKQERIIGVAFSPDVGYGVLLDTEGPLLRLLQYSPTGEFLETHIFSAQWMDRGTEIYKAFAPKTKTGEYHREFLPMSFQWEPQSEKHTGLLLGNNMTYSMTDRTLYYTEPPTVLHRTEDGEALWIAPYRPAQDTGAHRTQWLAGWQDEEGVNDYFFFESLGKSSILDTGIEDAPAPVVIEEGEDYKIHLLDPQGYATYTAAQDDSEEQNIAELVEQVESLGIITLNFSAATGEIEYFPRFPEGDEGKLEVIAHSPKETYTAYKVFDSSAGDGHQYDVALYQPAEERWQWLSKGSDANGANLEFVGEDMLYRFADQTLYSTEGLRPLRTVEFFPPAETPYRMTLASTYDALQDRFVLLTAHSGWSGQGIGFEESPYVIEIYDGTGQFLQSIEAQVLSEAQGRYQIIPPRLILEEDILTVWEQRDDTLAFTIDLYTQEILEISPEARLDSQTIET